MSLESLVPPNILLEEAEIMRVMESDQLKRQIKILSTFLPYEIINRKLTELNKVQSFVAVVLWGDISGMSLMSERYTKAGNGGIHRLTATLHSFYGCIIEVLRFYGGDILKFSDDAFLAMWRRGSDICLYKVINEVIVASLFIQHDLDKLFTKHDIQLKLKLTVACGDVTFAVIGDEELRDFVVIGTAIENLMEAKHNSLKGDIVIAPSAWGHIAEDDYEVSNGCPGCVKIVSCVYQTHRISQEIHEQKRYSSITNLCKTHLHYRKSTITNDIPPDRTVYLKFVKSFSERDELINISSCWSITDIRAFIPKHILNYADAYQFLDDITEVKDITIQFISILLKGNMEPNITITNINSLFETVYKIVSNHAGAVNSVWFSSNDIKIMSGFGVTSTDSDLQSLNALKSGYKLWKQLSSLSIVKGVSVGITRGLLYCGIIGHPARKHFFTIGAAANKAVKISRVFLYKVSCDHHTYVDSKQPSCYFQSLRPESNDFGIILEYNEEFKEKVVLDKHIFPLLERNVEMDLIRLVLKQSDLVQNYRGICFHGKPKIGKTRLLEETINTCLKYGYTVASVNLCGRVQRPYFSVSLLYRQLYDAITKTEKLKKNVNIPRELWDLSGVLHTNDATRKDDTVKILMEMCSIINSVVVLIVDNVQYIDTQSYEVIVAAFNSKRNLRFICAGQFEEDTWDVRWKMSLNKHIKTIEVRSLPAKSLDFLLCNFLNVKGVDKKLIKFLQNNREITPGILKMRLENLLQQKLIEIKRVFYSAFAEHRYVFQDATIKQTIAIPVVKVTAPLDTTNDNLTASAIIMQLYHSFTSHQQLVVRTAAVIGEIFSEKLLLAILGNPKETIFVEIIKDLFQKGVFDCATRYITCGGLVDNLQQCYCFLKEGYENNAQCKLIYFKDRNLRVEVYNLLFTSEKKELHLKIVDYLENQDNSCSKCNNGNCIPIIKLETLNYFIKHYNAVYDETDESKFIQLNQSRKSLKAADCLWKVGNLHCLCIELLIEVCTELIYHCNAGSHTGKQIFFLMQYGVILMTLGENEEAIKPLADALQLCITAKTDSTLDSKLKKSLCTRLHLLLAEAYIVNGNVDEAKKYVVSSLMHNNIQMSVLSRRKLFVQAMEIFPCYPDVIVCVSLLSKIFAAEAQLHTAKVAALRSIKMLRKSVTTIEVRCQVYRNAIELFSTSENNFLCKKLEKCVRKDVFRKFEGGNLADFHIVYDLMNTIFKLHVSRGNLNKAVKLGLRTLEFSQYLQTSHALFNLIPTLATLLLFTRRIEDAVMTMKILKHHANSREFFIAYYAFCVELNNETSLILEPIDECLKMTTNYLKGKSDLTPIETKLIINVYSYLLRNRLWQQAEQWNVPLNFESIELTSFISISNFVRGIECILLLLDHELDMKKNYVYAEEDVVSHVLKKCEEIARQWKVFLPRTLHFKAYFYELMSLNTKTKQLLKEASDIAKQQGNILECCWIDLNMSVWNGGFSFGNNMKNIDWKLEKKYTVKQWSQILFSLPTSSN